MGRIARVVAAGAPHHVTQLGNNRQQVFSDSADREMFLRLLREQCGPARIRVLGYCLMSNHAHLVAVPEREASFARGLGQVHLRYSLYFNLRYRRCGRLWRNRFFSCPLERSHLKLALRYVDLNPVRAGMVAAALDYPWSSAAAHVQHRDTSGLLDMAFWAEFNPCRDWGEVLEQPPDEVECDKLRHSTLTGRPMGEPAFSRELEISLNRSLELRKPGRPRKADQQPALATSGWLS